MNEKESSAAIVLDVEFTAWPNSMATGWRMPGQFKEIIQLGAVKVDRKFHTIESFCAFICPRINPVLTPYIEGVTGITNADIASCGKPFPDVWESFLSFCGDLPLIAYGRDDLTLRENMRLNSLPDTLPPYTNIVGWMAAQNVDVEKGHGCDVGPAVGVPFEGHPHNALDDAASLAAGIAAVLAKGAPTPVGFPNDSRWITDRDRSTWRAWEVPDEADTLIKSLNLTPHPEGGCYREIFRDAPGPDGRAKSTGIYFLLRAGECSARHRIDAAEVWHYYRGAGLELVIEDEDGTEHRHTLGPMVEAGEEPQIVVPPHRWQSARSLGNYTLVGCTVAPGFEFQYFEIGDK